MTIVMEEDAFSSSLSSLSTLSPQSNYQALLSGRDSLNSSYLSNNSTTSPGVNSNQQSSPNSNTANPDCPYAIFIFRTNGNNSSELFEERRIMLDKSCKIGRSVAKIRPEPNNAIFDCKVLSRNHALLWEENGKFYIQDTKSSNGTFLNGNRLGKSNEDSPPYDLTSGDIIQFGVDVTENTKKVTHGCITVEVRLFHRNGVEAINKPAQQNNKVDVQTQELYQLALFLQEAMMREEILNQKLNSLQSFIDQAKQTSENGWLTLIQEDRLLSRIDCLEKQSNLNNKSITEDQFKKTINALREEKLKIEDSAKETIQKMIEEKIDSKKNLDELKAIHDIQTQECSQLNSLNEEFRSKILDLAAKNQDLLSQIESIQNELEDAKNKYNEKCSSAESEKTNLESQIAEYIDSEKKLTAQIELLIAEKDIQSKQLEGLLTKFEQTKQLNEFYLKKIETYEQDLESKENVKLEPIEQIKDENNPDLINSEDSDETDKKLTVKNEVLNDLSNNLVLGEGDLSTKDVVAIVLTNCLENLEDEKENLAISSDDKINQNDVNRAAESGIHEKSRIDSLNTELNKLNVEIEELKLKLEMEINSNLKLKNELGQIKDQSTEAIETDPNFDNLLKEKAAKLDELEKELEEKNSLIEKLLTSKKELLNLNLTNVLNLSKINDSFDTNVSNSTNLNLENEENKSCCFSNECYMSFTEHDQFKAQIQVIQLVAKQFLEDREVLEDKSAKKDTYFEQLEESCRKLEELREIIESKRTKNEISTYPDKDNDSKIKSLESRIRELQEQCDEYKSKLDTTGSVLEDLNEGYDNLSLRANIVSYFSMLPVSFLIIAILVAFYPILAKITVTDL
ncbi:unnamed protein product [Brachionus calyciflorus]|uniref:FHA domain-containing protein n=1 Tax=Brachionus calyciflorus TaxID=104777 RepID=A0A813M0D3_9BILA|nr:unnamed protein product [Brachionus calyciflorus]